MGLFADLLAVSKMAPPANPANVANPAQVVNPIKAPLPEIRRFAGFARGADSAIEVLERFATDNGVNWFRDALGRAGSNGGGPEERHFSITAGGPRGVGQFSGSQGDSIMYVRTLYIRGKPHGEGET